MNTKRSLRSVRTENSESKNKNVIFVSYSHEDREWMDRLASHLAVLQSQDLLTLWDDRRIGAGSMWEHEIKEAIEQSSVAILLITANFLRSKFIIWASKSRSCCSAGNAKALKLSQSSPSLAAGSMSSG